MDISDLLETVTFKRRQTPVFIHESCSPQVTDFPKFIIDYIIANPKSPKQWKKLIQTCKLWFDKNSIVVIPCLHFNDHVGAPKGWKTCSSGFCKGQRDQSVKIFDTSVKFWITENLEDVNGCIGKQLIPKIYKCDVKKLILYDEILTLEEILFFTQKVVDASICVRVEDEYKRHLPCEEVIQHLPTSLEKLYFIFHNDVTPDTVKKLSEMEHIRKLQELKLFGDISPPFDLDVFLQFVLENKHIDFELEFYAFSATRERRNKVKAFAETLLKEDYVGHRRPWMRFNRKILVTSD